MNISNWFNFLENHWIIALVGSLLPIFAIDLIQLIISCFSPKLSKEEQEQLKEICRLRRKVKFDKPPNL